MEELGGRDRSMGECALHVNRRLSQINSLRYSHLVQLDKFDNQRRFVRVLPPLAREHPHLRFSMLALSARQLERKFPDRPATSLGLYQEAIHQLVPQLQTRTTTVVASCVVLCVLEMMSCKLQTVLARAGLPILTTDLDPGSPKMWRRHLDGSASLILSLGINGFSGGLEQALFWCFARMGESSTIYL